MTREAAPSRSTTSNDWIKSGTMLDRNGSYNHYNSNLGGSWNSSSGGVTIGGPLNHSSIKNHDDLVTVTGTLGNTGGWQLSTKTDTSHNMTEQDSKGGNGNYEIEVGRVHVSGTISLSSSSLDLDVVATTNTTAPNGTSVLTGGGTITHNRQHDYSASGGGTENVSIPEVQPSEYNPLSEETTTLTITNTYINTIGQSHIDSSFDNSTTAFGVVNNVYQPLTTTTSTMNSSEDHDTAVLRHITLSEREISNPSETTTIRIRSIVSSNDSMDQTNLLQTGRLIDWQSPGNDTQSRSGNNHLEKHGMAKIEDSNWTQASNSSANENINTLLKEDNFVHDGTLGNTPEADTYHETGAGAITFNGVVYNSYVFMADQNNPHGYAAYRGQNTAAPPDASNVAPSNPTAPGVPAKAAAVNGAVGAHASSSSIATALNEAVGDNKQYLGHVIDPHSIGDHGQAYDTTLLWEHYGALIASQELVKNEKYFPTEGESSPDVDGNGMVGGQGDLCQRFPETCGPRFPDLPIPDGVPVIHVNSGSREDTMAASIVQFIQQVASGSQNLQYTYGADSFVSQQIWNSQHNQLMAGFREWFEEGADSYPLNESYTSSVHSVKYIAPPGDIILDALRLYFGIGDIHPEMLGSFLIQYEATIDTETNEVSFKGRIFNVWSVESATRNPNSRRPIVSGDFSKIYMVIEIEHTRPRHVNHP